MILFCERELRPGVTMLPRNGLVEGLGFPPIRQKTSNGWGTQRCSLGEISHRRHDSFLR
jgi:hypothetical protein